MLQKQLGQLDLRTSSTLLLEYFWNAWGFEKAQALQLVRALMS
jgi:hypothetical protein